VKDVPLSTLWKLIEIASAVQVVNAMIDVALWILNGIEVPAWALALSIIWYTVLIFALKQAITDEKNRVRIENANSPHSPRVY
jgi:hypothetical protein